MTGRKLSAAVGVAVVPLALTAAVAHARADGPKPADVAVRVLPSSPEVYVGRRIVYNVMVSNIGGVDAESVGVDVTVGGDAGASVVEVTEALGSCEIAQPTHVTCSIDLLPRNKMAKIRVIVHPTVAGRIDVSARTSAPADADAANNSAAATTMVHPGQPGPPEISNEKGPDGAAPNLRRHVAVVRGRIGVSEPASVSVQVIGSAGAKSVPLLAGSFVGSTRVATTRTTVTVPLGDQSDSGRVHAIYALHLPLSKLRPDHKYAIVVQSVDLEGQPGNTLRLGFKLLKKKK